MKKRNQVLLPINFEAMIQEDDSVRKLVEICDELDYSKLYKEYDSVRRKTSPETMFEIVVYGYMRGLYSTRKIEDACKRDICFMWILQNESCPDHSTISRFMSKRLSPVVEDLFYQLVMKLFEMGEIAFENMFVDGTKIEANANRYTFVWAKAVRQSCSDCLNSLYLDVSLIHFSNFSNISIMWLYSISFAYGNCLLYFSHCFINPSLVFI